MRKFIRRNRVIVSATAAVVAALLIGVAAFAWQAKVARDQRDNAERAAYQAQLISAATAVEEQRVDAARALLSATAPRLRGWEYRHLESRLDRSLSSPFPSEWRISGIVMSQNSNVIAVRKIDPSAPGRPEHWVVLEGDLRTDRLVLPRTEDGALALSPDGTRVAFVSDDQQVAQLWSVTAKKMLATLTTRPLMPLNHALVTWSPSGDRFIVSHEDDFGLFDGHIGSLLHRKKVPG